MKTLKTEYGTKASMQKKLESLRRGKKSEGAAREYTSRIDSLVASDYLTMEDVAEFLLRAFSEDDIKKAYGWMEQDELIPSESQLADDGVKFNDDGALVSLDSDESYRRTRRAHSDRSVIPNTRKKDEIMNNLSAEAEMKTYDVHFNDSNDSNSKGFETTIEDAMSYITSNNGTDNSYFADYKGGIVSIVCNQDGETVYEEEVW